MGRYVDIVNQLRRPNLSLVVPKATKESPSGAKGPRKNNFTESHAMGLDGVVPFWKGIVT